VHFVAAERLNASLSSFLGCAEHFAGASAARAEDHSAEELAGGLPHATVDEHSTVEPAGNSSRHNAALASDVDARLLRELRGDALRAVKAGVLGSADPALLMRLLPALHAYVEAGRHVTLSYDEVRTLAVTASAAIWPVCFRPTFRNADMIPTQRHTSYICVQDTANESVQAILTALEASITAMLIASQPNMPQQASIHARSTLVPCCLCILSLPSRTRTLRMRTIAWLQPRVRSSADGSHQLRPSQWRMEAICSHS